MKNYILGVLFLFPIIITAQNDTIQLDQSISIYEQGLLPLIKKYNNILKERGGVNGWRVQLKFKAKEAEIIQLKLKFIKLYPDIPIFLEYHEPYYRIRVGNCRTKLEALKIKNKIIKDFPGSYPVPEIINFESVKK